MGEYGEVDRFDENIHMTVISKCVYKVRVLITDFPEHTGDPRQWFNKMLRLSRIAMDCNICVYVYILDGLVELVNGAKFGQPEFEILPDFIINIMQPANSDRFNGSHIYGNEYSGHFENMISSLVTLLDRIHENDLHCNKMADYMDIFSYHLRINRHDQLVGHSFVRCVLKVLSRVPKLKKKYGLCEKMMTYLDRFEQNMGERLSRLNREHVFITRDCSADGLIDRTGLCSCNLRSVEVER